MKIALISPEYYDIAHFGAKRKEIPPFGVMYLAAIAEQCGATVTIYRVSNENYILNLLDYDIVGFTIPSSVIYSLIKKVRVNSKVRDDALLIAGGIHATLYPNTVLDELSVNLLCISEGEETFKEILNAYKTNQFKNIKGLAYKQKDDLIVTGKRDLIKDIDSIPFPARHLMPIGDIIMNDRLSDTPLRVVHILCSRGCPYNCYFCANQEHGIRYRSSKNIKNELEYLQDKYNIEGFCITDDNFIVQKRNIIDICSEITTLNLKWSSLSRVDTVDLDVLKILKEAGCVELKYGIESGSQRILNAMNKQITVEQISKAIDLTNSVGIKVKAFIIHGFPGENMESTKETISLLYSLKSKISRVSVFRFVPLPGSYVFTHNKEYRLTVPACFEDIYIYNNSRKWWGNNSEKKELEDSYKELEKFVKTVWGRF
jgi:radical SAM superfamily enzyme YgiQ (UPF0313 family)